MKAKQKISPEDALGLAARVDPFAWAFVNKLEVLGGQFQVPGYEYQVEPLRSKEPIRVMKKATQLGLTQVEVIRALHQCIHGDYKQGILYLFPTRGDVTDFSNSRFKPMIADNKASIGKYVRDSGIGGTDQANIKRIGDAFLYFRGARMALKTEAGIKDAHGMKSIPVDAVVFDEFDEMPADAQPLAISRMANSPHKNETYLANPTIPDWGIDRMYQQSNQKVWMITCGKCGKETCLELEFPGCLRKRSGAISARGIVIHMEQSAQIYRACVHCGAEIYPKNGNWRAQRPQNREIDGLWMSHLMSVRSDMTKLLRDFRDPKTDLSKFYNLQLGMAYIAAENRLTENDVIKRCGTDVMDVRHDGPCGMGVDVGKTLHVVIGVRTGEHAIKIVKIVRLTEFNDVFDLAKQFNVKTAVFDLYPETRAVREFGAAAPYPVYGCDYQEGQRGKATWNETSATVVVNRTEIFDTTHNLVTDQGRLVLPRMDAEVREYAFEMCQTAKVLVEDETTGKKVYRYRKLGAEHYRNATNYLELACRKIPLYSGGAYSNNPPVVPSGYRYNLL